MAADLRKEPVNSFFKICPIVIVLLYGSIKSGNPIMGILDVPINYMDLTKQTARPLTVLLSFIHMPVFQMAKSFRLNYV